MKNIEKDLPLYYPHRKNIQSGDTLQWKTDGSIGWSIRFFRTVKIFIANLFKGKWVWKWVQVNHSSLVVKGPEFSGAEERRWQLEALWQGVVLRKVSDRLYVHKGQVWWLPLLSEYDYKREAISKIAYNYIGVGYDFLDVVRQIWRRVKAGGTRLFCSELCYWVYHMARMVGSIKAPPPDKMPELRLHRKGVRIK